MTRNHLSLSGEWLIRPDPANVGLAEEWFKPPEHPVPAGAWRPIRVPAAWQHVLGEEYHYLAWYEKRINLPQEWAWPTTRLRFDSVATEIEIWIDGSRIGRHVGDWIPIEFDITDAIRGKRSFTITARVDECLGHITKGFHDMLSIHHGGIWGGVWLIGSGEAYAIPNGVHVLADAERQSVSVNVTRMRESDPSRIHLVIQDPRGNVIGEMTSLSGGQCSPCAFESVDLWSPDSPDLYRMHVEILDENGVADLHDIPFGFRIIRTRGTHILLNNSPLQIRGVLHWGHEPQHLAPAPPPEQVRDEFARLRALGFNCVCLCMWYPPEHYYEIADETGMLIWQEHPVWHSPMDAIHHDEYRRLFRAFMHRDRNHPSIVIVSSTCEHPTYHPDLELWWKDTARVALPDKLLQVQTASLAWSKADQTDLYDEHTYDNCDRWPAYLRDLQDVLGSLPPKPFVMGETILGTSWAGVTPRSAWARWSVPSCHESMRAFEEQLIDSHGPETLKRFVDQADRHHLLIRKFQYETFRRYPNHAGLVMNHLRDVPACTCGFMDAFGTWRFDARDTGNWLTDRVLLLATPDEGRSFFAGEPVDIRIALSNFGNGGCDGDLRLDFDDGSQLLAFPMTAPGDVAWITARIQMPACTSPRAAVLRASLNDVANEWKLWVFPRETTDWTGVSHLTDLPFTEQERAPERWERGYSRGFGIAAKSWVSRPPEPEGIAPRAQPWYSAESIPADSCIIITHRLTKRACDFLESGGRVLLMASGASGGLNARYEWLFGQCPLVLERGPLHARDSEWVIDLLNFDLTATWSKVIPVEELGIANCVAPIVRLVYTHDQPHIRLFDQMFLARVGSGILAASSFDHRTPAGRHLLGRIIALLRRSPLSIDACLPPALLRKFVYESNSALQST